MLINRRDLSTEWTYKCSGCNETWFVLRSTEPTLKCCPWCGKTLDNQESVWQYVNDDRVSPADFARSLQGGQK